MTTYRLTLVDEVNRAEHPKVIYLRGATRKIAERRAKAATAPCQIIVDLVSLD